MTRVLAIIPARGGSKGVPGKNLRPVLGKPLIVWTVEQALATPEITDTVVSTDDAEIARIAKEAGAWVPFLRPAELATDTCATEPVMRHALVHMEELRGAYDAVMLLQPTSPLRRPGTISRAVEQYSQTGADSLLSVVESHAFFWRAGDPPSASYDWRHRPRRQDIPQQERSFRESGSIYLTERDSFLKESNRLAGKISLFQTAECEGWEIDSLTDFAIVETLMKQEFAH